MDIQEKTIKYDNFFSNIAVILIFLNGILSPEIVLGIQLVLIFLFFIKVRKIRNNRSFLFMIFCVGIHAIINIINKNDTIILMAKQIIGITVSFTFYYNIIDNKQKVHEIFKKYVSFSKYIAIFSIIQQVAHIFHISPIYDMRWIVKEQLAPANTLYRSMTIFREPSELALILFPSAFLSLYYFIGQYRKNLYGITNKITSLIIIVGYFFTFSSSGYIGILIGCIFIWIEYFQHKHIFKQFCILGTIIIIFFTLYNVVPVFKLRLNDTISVLKNHSNIGKSNISSQTIIINMNIAKESILNTKGFGSGLGSHIISYNKYINKLELSNVKYFFNKEDANSLLLRVISELGLIGITIILIFLYKNRNNEINTINNIYSKTCLLYFLLRFLRYGHYFYGGLWMFVVIYIILSKKDQDIDKVQDKEKEEKREKMKITIITITYNSEKTIEETILSVINQNYKELEYIIIDGGSKDNTLSIINKYKDKISKIITEPDNGISDAFNKGIKLATGDMIGIINSDDMLNKDALNKLNDVVQKYPDYDIYYGNSIIFDEKNEHIYKPNCNIDNILKYMFISHPATFVRKSCYEKYGIFDINYKCAMDFELLSKMYLNGAKFKYFDYECTWFRLGGASRTKDNITKKESIQIAIRNGIGNEEANRFFNKVEKKQKYIDFANKIGIENFLRKIIKKQGKPKVSRKWYMDVKEND